MKVLSLFSGIGAFEKALSNIGIDYDLTNYCEIDEHASKCYSLIHNVDEEKNLCDVTKIDETKLEDIGLITHGSPCQSFSLAGKQEGGEKGSGTKSSLLWETIRIVKHKTPKYVIWENVKNVVKGKHLKVFKEYLNEMENIGYVNYVPKDKKGRYGTLNAKDYGIPQNRERVFVVSVRKDIDDGTFKFPSPIDLESEVLDYAHFREEDDITDNFHKRYIEVKGDISRKNFEEYIENLPIRRGIGTKKMGLYNFSETDTITTVNGITGTLTCRNVQNYNKKFWYSRKLYKPSPRMCWRLMGFTDEDFDKVKDIGSDSDLWDRAGNSIVVNVLERIFERLLGDFRWNTNQYATNALPATDTGRAGVRG